MSDEFRITDEEIKNTPLFRALILSEFKSIRDEIKNAHDCIDRIDSRFTESVTRLELGFDVFRDKMWDKVNNHEDRLTRSEASLGLLVKVSWALFATSLGVIGMAFWKLVLK